ncbi:MAG: hypothetical protein P8X94_03560, partial [Woeseiaceae bacterium]
MIEARGLRKSRRRCCSRQFYSLVIVDHVDYRRNASPARAAKRAVLAGQQAADRFRDQRLATRHPGYG